jgi:hypothetical protein
MVLVLNGNEEKAYSGIIGSETTFSPDSRTIAYLAEEAGKRFVVVNAHEGERHDTVIRGSRVAFDGDRVLHYLALEGTAIMLMEVELAD